MITFRDPPPLPARVQARPRPDATTRTGTPLRWRLWLTCTAGIVLLALGGMQLQHRQQSIDAMSAAVSNTNVAQTERLLLERLPIGTPIARVAQQLDDARVMCRRELPAATTDSALVCLARPQIRANTYTRMVLRFEYRAATLVALDACPALMHWSRTALPTWLLHLGTSAEPARCWRDRGNVADNEWSYAAVPDSAFTVAAVHASDTTSRDAPATYDTLLVHW